MADIAHANTVLLLAAALILAGILSSLIATRFGAPMLLVFLGLGMVAGEDGLGIQFSDYSLAYRIGSLALALILFDGGLNTRLTRMRRALGPAIALATAGVLITALLAAGVAVWALHLEPLPGFLVGAIIASTDAAAVFFLLRSGGLRLKPRVSATLEIESGINDPFAIFLTLLTVSLILNDGNAPFFDALFHFLREALVGTGMGVAGGFAIVALLNRLQLPSGLHPLLVVCASVVIYGAAAELGGSGFLAAYIAGFVVGNRPVRAFASIASLNDSITWLAQIVMFLVLGLLVTPHTLLNYALPALGLALFVILVARPLMVWLCLAPFGFDWREKFFVGWVGLRGAVSIFLSAVPVLVGLPDAAIYFNVAFFVVLVSLLLQGWTIKSAARMFHQALPRETARVNRVELDLPGQLDFEMVGYPIYVDSPVLNVTPLPSWARIALVIRYGEILEPGKVGKLSPGDYAYVLAPPLKVQQLDRIFAHAAERPQLSRFTGEFSIRGDAPIGALADLYALSVDGDARRLSVAQLFAERFDTPPDIGESLELGNALLVVRERDGELVSRAGLQWQEELASFDSRISRLVTPWKKRG